MGADIKEKERSMGIVFDLLLSVMQRNLVFR
jgi:hypothetical protein